MHEVHAGADADTWLAFGPFTLSRNRKLLLESERAVRIGGRALELLLVLAERAGQTVGREELLARVWPHAVVEENSLRVHVSALRKALGETDESRYIMNVPGQGYRFVMPVTRKCEQGWITPAVDGGSPATMLPLRSERPIGREAAIMELVELMRQRRMLTIVGPGGIGKTTLALAVACGIRLNYRNGACFVDLSPVADPDSVPSALAAALGFTIPAADVGGAIAGYLRGCDMLIVFDNCEHVADAVALLIERILDAAPQVSLMATSREALFVRDETVFRLEALALPKDGDVDMQQALAYPAVQLFAQRARGHGDRFVLSEANLPVVIGLCAQLDGIPLAIELAAARVETLGVEGLAARLDSLFALLTRGRRMALPRHRTLLALFDWSYELLGDDERAVLCRLSCFRSAFTLDSAVSLCAGDGFDAPDVVDCVLELAVKSLVAVDTTVDPPLYRLLNTTRLYAARRLEERGEGAAMARRHARSVLELYRRADADLKRMPTAQWRLLYGQSAEDFHAALDWAFGEQGDARLGIELTACAWRVMLEFGRIVQFRTWVERALALLPAVAPPCAELELRLLSALSMVSGHKSDATEAQEGVFRRLQEIIRAHGADDLSLEALHTMAAWSFAQGNYPLMQIFAGQAGVMARRMADPAALLLADRLDAMALHFLGRHGRAEELAGRVLASPLTQRQVHLHGPVPRAVSMRALQARMLWLRGRADDARALAAEALELADGEHPFAMCQALSLAAIPVALWRGEDEAAARLCDRLDDMARRNSVEFWQSWAHGFRHAIALRTGGAREAFLAPRNAMEADHLGTVARAMADEACLGRVDRGLVAWCAPEIIRAHAEERLEQEGDAGLLAAEAAFLRALELARAQGAPAWQLRVATSLARLWADSGRAGEAAAMLADVLAPCVQGRDCADPRAARSLLERLGERA